ncbi:MAG TPA: hypothetical protein PLP33_27110 [Leptospiraceae bacterium]|nr:hypothetical protein [Leptospiraceae bacterium]
MDNIVETYNKTKSTVQTAKLLNLSYYKVNKYLKEHGIILKVGNLVKHTFNHEYFQVPTEENSYWAGFIAGDGYMSRNEVIISISEKDRNHLEKFKTAVEFSGELKHYIHNIGYSSNYHYNRISLCSKNMCNDLITNWFITKNKTFTLEFPSHLQDSLLFSYVLGYIDADGAFCRTNGFLKSLNIAGHEIYLQDMRAFLADYLKLDLSSIKIYPDHSIHRVMITRKEALLSLRTAVLDNFKDLPLLKRKWDILKCANLEWSGKGRKPLASLPTPQLFN